MDYLLFLLNSINYEKNNEDVKKRTKTFFIYNRAL